MSDRRLRIFWADRLDVVMLKIARPINHHHVWRARWHEDGRTIVFGIERDGSVVHEFPALSLYAPVHVPSDEEEMEGGTTTIAAIGRRQQTPGGSLVLRKVLQAAWPRLTVLLDDEPDDDKDLLVVVTRRWS